VVNEYLSVFASSDLERLESISFFFFFEQDLHRTCCLPM